MDIRKKIEEFLVNSPPTFIGDIKVEEVILTDGIKLRLAKKHWLMFRFSGTEPLLRIYCEAPNEKMVSNTLRDAKNIIDNKL